MSTPLQNFAIESFLSSYRDDLDFAEVDENNVVLSFPVHFSGFHRVEVTVTHVNPSLYLISDGAKTIDELKNAGYRMTTRLRERIEKISRFAQLRIVNDHLVSESSSTDLGMRILRFVEAAKTIGDAYLVQRVPNPKDTNLLSAVSRFLEQQNVPFQVNKTLQGKIEKHTVDFLFPPNGVSGLALSVVNNPTKMVAESWHFKAFDLRQTERVKVGVIYDPEVASDRTKSIFKQSVDIAVPSTTLPVLSDEMRSIGILKRIG